MKESPSTIETIWGQSETDITAAKKLSILKSLRREAEIAVADLGQKADAAEEAVTEAIRGTLKGTATVASVFELKRAAKIARKKHEDAVADYVELFGAQPVLQ